MGVSLLCHLGGICNADLGHVVDDLAVGEHVLAVLEQHRGLGPAWLSTRGLSRGLLGEAPAQGGAPIQVVGGADVHGDAILLGCRRQGEWMPLPLPAQEDILASLVRKALWNLKGQADDIPGQQLDALQSQVEALVARQQQPVHHDENGGEEEPDPKPGRSVQEQEHVDEFPSHVHTPEEVEPAQSARDAVCATSGTGDGREEDGQHEESEDDASQCRTAVLEVQDLLQQGHAARLLLGTKPPKLQRV